MSKKPDLILITTTPQTVVPRESFDELKRWILVDGLKPSVALRQYMEKYTCPNPDSSIVIELIRHTYPNIDISDRSFTFKIHDSGYPSVQVDMKDDGFDDLVNEMRAFAPVDLPMEFADNFKRWVLMDKLKPSVALRKLMEKYNCSEMDVAVPIKLLELTYPDINVTCNGFRFKIVDSAYPNSDPKQFSDEDFDQGIEELLSLPPAEW